MSTIRAKSLDAIAQPEFVTYGIEQRGQLLVRAVKVLSQLSEPAILGESEDCSLLAAIRLVRAYAKCQEILFKPDRLEVEEWIVQRRVWTLMNACLQRALRPALELRHDFDRASSCSELYAVASEVIRQYDTYCAHRERTNYHVRRERRILESKRQEFLVALVTRDGRICQGNGCQSIEDLRIDHIKPLALGGLTVLDNLQLLCAFCNGSKGNRTMDYLQYMNEKRKTRVRRNGRAEINYSRKGGSGR